MTDFDLAITGVDLREWSDPSRTGWVTRLNPIFGRSMLRYVATVGQPVTLTATVDGVEGEVDANLGGRLFFAESREDPGCGPVGFSSASGVSSVQTFTPQTPGHYLLLMRRPGGGAYFIHLDAEAA